MEIKKEDWENEISRAEISIKHFEISIIECQQWKSYCEAQIKLIEIKDLTDLDKELGV